MNSTKLTERINYINKNYRWNHEIIREIRWQLLEEFRGKYDDNTLYYQEKRC